MNTHLKSHKRRFIKLSKWREEAKKEMRVPGISGQQELENIQEKDTTFPREAKEQGEDVCVGGGGGGGASGVKRCFLLFN